MIYERQEEFSLLSSLQGCPLKTGPIRTFIKRYFFIKFKPVHVEILHLKNIETIMFCHGFFKNTAVCAQLLTMLVPYFR